MDFFEAGFLAGFNACNANVQSLRQHITFGPKATLEDAHDAGMAGVKEVAQRATEVIRANCSESNRFRHVKTGGLYTVLAQGKLEATLERVVIYMGGDGVIWVRPTDNFFDGRFVAVPAIDE